MSNIGKRPIEVKEGVTVDITDGKVVITGPKGSLEVKIPSGIVVEKEENRLYVKKRDTALPDSIYGLISSLIKNSIIGAGVGYEKKLELSGVGYRAKVEGSTLVVNIGFTHPVKVDASEGISFKVEENIISVMGANKGLVGNTASIIRKIKVADPYKAKGIKYLGERIRRKTGKAAKAVGTS